MRVVLAALTVCALAPAAEAKCAMWGLKPEVLTPSGATISPDGGFLVGAMDAEDGTLEPGDPAAQAGWRLRLGSRVATPTLVPLAPGLVLYKLPADAKDAQLTDDKRATVGRVTVGAKPASLPAPKLAKLTHQSGRGRKPFGRVVVELAGAAPDGAFAIVLADAKGKPRSWGKLTKGEPTLLAYERTRCRVLANATVESQLGDKVTAFWVDASGRKSPLSAVVTVGGSPDPANDKE